MICKHCEASWTDGGSHCPACGTHVTAPHPIALVVTPRGVRMCCTTTELDDLVEEAERRNWVIEEYWSPEYAAMQHAGKADA